MSGGPTGPTDPTDSTDLLAGFATVDVDRERRQGLPEVIYAPGKTPEQIAAIAARLLATSSGAVFATRVEAAVAARVQALTAPSDPGPPRYDAAARLLVWRTGAPVDLRLAVVTAGTADLPVAAEAAAVAAVVGMDVATFHDRGVAGLHRVLEVAGELGHADAVVVVAGMEGALASVVGGLVGVPVIAVPTSTGYGAALDGVTALLAMLSSCAAGVTVVNIDSGFGAALAAYRLTRRAGGRPLS